MAAALIPYLSNSTSGGPERGTSSTAKRLITTFLSPAKAEATASPNPPGKERYFREKLRKCE